MVIFFSTSPGGNLVEAAKTSAILGATIGLAAGVFDGILSVRRNRSLDGYDIAADALTHVATGAVLGALGATAAGLAGISLAAVAGRGSLAIAVPLIASAVVTGVAHDPVDRLVRSLSEGAVKGVKRAFQREGSPSVVRGTMIEAY